jgi:hypothetical protein
MQSQPLHIENPALLLGVGEAFSKRGGCAGAKIPSSPLDTLPMAPDCKIFSIFSPVSPSIGHPPNGRGPIGRVSLLFFKTRAH